MKTQPYVRIPLHGNGRTSAQSIVHAVLQEIETGNIPEELRLPPVRVLAHQFHVSKNTVASGYTELVARGKIRADGTRGYFVCRMDKDRKRRLSFAVPPPELIDAGFPRSTFNGTEVGLADCAGQCIYRSRLVAYRAYCGMFSLGAAAAGTSLSL
jgi:hypothetical protein